MLRTRFRAMRRNVIRKWFGGLLTTVLLTAVLLYSWRRKTPLPHPYEWSPPHTTTTTLSLHHPDFFQSRGADIKGHNSVLSRRIEEVVGKGGVVHVSVLKDEGQDPHSTIADNQPDPLHSPAPSPQVAIPGTSQAAGRGGSQVWQWTSGMGAGDDHRVAGIGRGLAAHEGSPRRASFRDVSDIDIRLLLPRSGSGAESAACSPHHHLVFVKVHKAASSTLANIIQRYGFTRDLNFVLPNRTPRSVAYNYITKRGEAFNRSSIIPLPPGGHYDLLWNHAIYNRSAFGALMPQDTVYVSILREPFQQFVSAYAFYNYPYISKFIALHINPFSHYLHYMPHPRALDYFRNKQSEDLGMGPQHVLNSTLRHQYLRQLDKELHLVLITELFDESLVLLRRLMCWSVKDILYISKNTNVYKPIFVFSKHDYARHRDLAAADYDLYQFFRHKLLRTLAAQGVDFEHEVTHFREMRREVQKFCEQAQSRNLKQFFVPRSLWSVEFTVTREDCHLLVMHELVFLDKLMAAQRAKVSPFSPPAELNPPRVTSPAPHTPPLSLFR
ncbi:galactosylceramide sulfotransferase-like [Babylonia areolata]|uniref:galactosylceramide sulfotransferase-like n=1 Tax=Babylonia areolata TaxID=304850 RepID=UPI003FD16607